MLIPAAVKEGVVNGDDHDDGTVKVGRMTERGRTVTTSASSKCSDQQQTSTVSTTTATAAIVSSTNITDESELLPKVYGDITQSTPSIAAMNKSDGKSCFSFLVK